MAIFSCISPDNNYATLPRRPVAGRSQSLDVTRRTPNAGLAGKTEKVNTLPTSHNGESPLSAIKDGHNYLAGRDLSPRKLQKRRRLCVGSIPLDDRTDGLRCFRRVTKSMIGAPADFIHCTNLARDDAMRLMNHGNSAPAPLRPQSRQSTSQDIPRQARNAVQPGQSPVAVYASQRQDTAPTREPLRRLATVTGRRKAPPPVTPSIIKAAGLPTTRNERTTVSRAQGLDPPAHSAGYQSSTLKGLRISPSMADILNDPEAAMNNNERPAATTADAKSPTIAELIKAEEGADAVLPLPPSGPLDYMTDSTKVKVKGSLAEIASQLRMEEV